MSFVHESRPQRRYASRVPPCCTVWSTRASIASTYTALCDFPESSGILSCGSCGPASSDWSVSLMSERKRVKRTDSAAHGTSEMKLHREPCWNASLTMVCTSGGSDSMLCKEERPVASPLASTPASAAERLPEVTRFLMIEFTLPFRTAPHCARPTVPPRARL